MSTMTTTTASPRKRTIHMPEARSRMLACLAAHLDTDAETLIQASISALMLSACRADPVLGFIIARVAGVDWQELEAARYADLFEQIA